MKFLRKLISPKTVVALIIALVVGQFVSPDVAFALTDGNDNETLKAFAQIFSVFVNIFTFLSLVFINYGGDLVGTDFLTAPEPMAAIRPMWVIIRNITNALFVLVLIFLAFSNLFSSFKGGDGNWTIKKQLPNVILALIAINFSLLGFKVVLDAVHVGAITIFAIPDSTARAKGQAGLQDALKNDVAVNKDGVVSYEPFFVAINDLMCGKGKWEDPVTEIRDKDTKVKGSAALPEDCLFAIDPQNAADSSSKSKAAQNLFIAFGIQFNRIQDMPSLTARLNDWGDVFTSVLFVSILSLAQVIALAAVFIALLVRMVVLWIAMVFSPLLIAGSIMGFGKGSGGKISEMVVTSVVMPLKIAAAFAVSFLMIDAMVNLGGGPSGDFIRTGSSVSTFGASGYGLLWSIATIVVFWKAAFWALEGSVAEGVINKIKGGAEGAGAFLAKAGTIDREIFPMPGEKGVQGVSTTTLMRTLNQGMVKLRSDKISKDYEGFTGPDGINMFNKSTTELTKAFNELGTNIEGASDAMAAFKMIDDKAVNSEQGSKFYSGNIPESKNVIAKLEKQFPKVSSLAGYTNMKTNFTSGNEDKVETALLWIAEQGGRNNAKTSDYEGKKKTDTNKIEVVADDDGKKITINNEDKSVSQEFKNLDDLKKYYNETTNTSIKEAIIKNEKEILTELESASYAEKNKFSRNTTGEGDNKKETLEIVKNND
jgi:hypothetical protein